MSPGIASPVGVPGLIALLREHHLLLPGQLEELEALAHSIGEMRPFSRELLQRGWVTSFQLNQLLQGRAHNLILEPYIILERLGEGGAGQVFKARHQVMKRVVALKVIRKELLTDPDALNRFYREIQVASQVDHPNIVHAYDAGPIGGTHMLVMEYVDGRDLARHVRDVGPLPADEACEYIRQAATGLHYIHRCGLIHRDIKPSNLLVAGLGSSTTTTCDRVVNLELSSAPAEACVKILDLGLARLQASASSTHLTADGSKILMGTPDFMAPEQALDVSNVDIRADIYSLGCTLFFLLTGQTPYTGQTLAQRLMKHQQAEIPSAHKLQPSVPPKVDAVLARMMAKHPDARYQTPAAVAQVLSIYLGKPLSASEIVLPAEPRKPIVELPSTAIQEPPAPTPLPPAEEAVATNLDAERETQLDEEDSTEEDDRTLVSRAVLEHSRRANRRRRWPLILGGALFLLGVTGGSLWWFHSENKPALTERPDPSINRQWTADDRLAWQPRELVTVLGDPRGRHWAPVHAVAFSPSGRTVASAGDDLVIRIWDSASRWEKASLGGPQTVGGPTIGHQTAIVGLAFRPDGQLLASIGRQQGNKASDLKVWDLTTNKEVRSISLKGTDSFAGVGYLPDGRTLATLVRKGNGPGVEVQIWDENYKEKSGAALDASQQPPVLSANGQALATTSRAMWFVWDSSAIRRQALASEGSKGTSINTLGLSPDGKWLATACINVAAGTSLLEIWDVARHQLKHEREVRLNQVTALGWSPDNKLLAVAGRRFDDGAVVNETQLWNAPEGTEARVLSGLTQAPACLAFAPDGQALVTGGADGAVRVWNTQTGKEQSPGRGTAGAVAAVAFSPDGRFLLSVGDTADQPPKLWDLAHQREQASMSAAGPVRAALGSGFRIGFCPDGATVLAWNMHQIRLWSPTSSKERTLFTSTFPEVRSVSLAPDGKTLVAALATRVKIWDVATGAEKEAPPVQLAQYTSAAFGPDSRLCAVGGSRPTPDKRHVGEVRFWDCAEGREPRPPLIEPHPVVRLAFSPTSGADWRFLALSGSGAEEGKVVPYARTWNLSDNKERLTLPTPRPETTSLRFSPNGQFLASWDTGALYLTDLDLGKQRLVAPGHWVGVAFSPDGWRLAVCSSAGVVELWDCVQGKKTHTWKLPGAVHDVAFNADGKQLAFANHNGSIYVLQLTPKP